ncbi:MAG: hypothetical protein V4550_12230 [Gemmatimonadota bacterium]
MPMSTHDDQKALPVLLEPVVSPSRVYSDPEQVVWRVFAQQSANTPGERAGVCLVFSSNDEVHRVWNYPTNWQTLDSRALTALSWLR